MVILPSFGSFLGAFENANILVILFWVIQNFDITSTRANKNLIDALMNIPLHLIDALVFW